ncbi:hypothetical protein LEMLEM_LOCUS23389 [Lemmus lemmus]
MSGVGQSRKARAPRISGQVKFISEARR